MKGFTLIETVIYIALLGGLLTGALIASADLIESAGTSNAHATLQDEGSFVLRKLEWAFSGAKTINIPASGSSASLRITKYDGTQVDVCLSGGKVRMHEGPANTLSCNDSSFNDITTSNVTVSSLIFTATTASGGLLGITSTTTMRTLPTTTSPADFVFTKYLRQ